MPRALIMKGGGVKGIALASAAAELEKHIRFDTYVGTSAGAIVAVLLAAGYEASQVLAELQTTDLRSFVDPWWQRPWNLLRAGGLNRGDELRRWIAELVADKIPKQGDVELRDLPNRAVLFASQTGRGAIPFDSNDTYADHAVRCSMSVPGFFTVVTHNGKRAWDGGLCANYPVEEFLKLSPDKDFVALYLSSGSARTKPLPWPIEVLQILITGAEFVTVDAHPDKTVVIDPSPIGTLDFSLGRREREFLTAEGRAAALEFLADPQRALVSIEEAEIARDVADAGRRAVIEKRKKRFRRRTARSLRSLMRPRYLIVLPFLLLVLWTHPAFREALCHNGLSFVCADANHDVPPVLRQKIAGKVVDRDSRVGIGDVAVALKSGAGEAPLHRTSTGPDGSFAVEVRPPIPASFSYRAVAAGYDTGRGDVGVAGGTIGMIQLAPTAVLPAAAVAEEVATAAMQVDVISSDENVAGSAPESVPRDTMSLPTERPLVISPAGPDLLGSLQGLDGSYVIYDIVKARDKDLLEGLFEMDSSELIAFYRYNPRLFPGGRNAFVVSATGVGWANPYEDAQFLAFSEISSIEAVGRKKLLINGRQVEFNYGPSRSIRDAVKKTIELGVDATIGLGALDE